jgi:hypothetical protein
MIERQSDRIVVRWPIRYERISPNRWSGPREALCVNVGGSGMLLLLDEVPEEDEMLRLYMRDVNRDRPFTLAQVRWSKPGTVRPSTTIMAGIEYVDQ